MYLGSRLLVLFFFIILQHDTIYVGLVSLMTVGFPSERDTFCFNVSAALRVSPMCGELRVLLILALRKNGNKFDSVSSSYITLNENHRPTVKASRIFFLGYLSPHPPVSCISRYHFWSGCWSCLLFWFGDILRSHVTMNNVWREDFFL